MTPMRISPVAGALTGPLCTLPAERAGWVDGARGIVVSLVVLLHVVIGHFYLLPWSGGDLGGIWDRIDHILSVVRLPALFLLSGYLSAGKIGRGWRSGRSLHSVAVNGYLYLLWLTLFGVFIWVLPDGYAAPHAVSSPWAWLVQVVLPDTYLWYILGLAVCVAVLTSLRKLPAVLVLATLLGVHVASEAHWGSDAPLWTRIPLCMLYFGIGAYCKRAISWLVRGSALFMFPAFALSALAVRLYGLERLLGTGPSSYPESLVLTGVALVMIAALLTACELIHRTGVPSAAKAIGRHSLAVYVFHVPVITCLNLLVTYWFPQAGAALDALPFFLKFAYPVVVAGLVVLVCLGIEKLLLRHRHLRYLLVPPPAVLSCADRMRGRLRKLS